MKSLACHDRDYYDTYTAVEYTNIILKCNAIFLPAQSCLNLVAYDGKDLQNIYGRGGGHSSIKDNEEFVAGNMAMHFFKG